MSPLPATTRDRYGSAGVDEIARREAARRARAVEPYRLDPTLPLREGRIRVWDPIALDEVVWEPFPNQIEDVVSWIDVDALGEGALRLRNVHVEKSRQEGDTTAFAYAFLWLLTYWPVPLLMQHEDFGEVADPGLTYDSFFGKIRFMWERWPAEIGRAPLAFTGGGTPLIRRTDSSTAFIVGESGNVREPGRGGRYAGGLIDEAARIRYDRQAQAALTRAIPTGRVMLSTPNGEGNVYYEIRQNRPAGWLFLRHHWTEHPIYSRGLHVSAGLLRNEIGEVVGIESEGDPSCVRCAAILAGGRYDPRDPEGPHRYESRPVSPWYDEAVVELTDEQVAQELDIDYAGSLSHRVYPEFSDAVHVADRDVPYDRYLRIETAWDFGLSNSVVICQEGPLEFRVIGEVEMEGTPEATAAAVDAELRALGVSSNEFGVRDTWLNVGDPAGESKQMATLSPLLSQYRAAGYNIVSQPTRSIQRTIDSVHRLLAGIPKPLVVSPRCTRFRAHAKANRYPVDSAGRRRSDEPKNDEHNHMMRAFAYLVHWKWPAPETGDSIREATRRRAEEDYFAEDTSGKLDPGLSYDMDF